VWSWRLTNATPEPRKNFQINGNGHGVHWPDVDEDISAIGMLDGIPARPTKQPVKALQFNRPLHFHERAFSSP